VGFPLVFAPGGRGRWVGPSAIRNQLAADPEFPGPQGRPARGPPRRGGSAAVFHRPVIDADRRRNRWRGLRPTAVTCPGPRWARRSTRRHARARLAGERRFCAGPPGPGQSLKPIHAAGPWCTATIKPSQRAAGAETARGSSNFVDIFPGRGIRPQIADPGRGLVVGSPRVQFPTATGP